MAPLGEEVAVAPPPAEDKAAETTAVGDASDEEEEDEEVPGTLISRDRLRCRMDGTQMLLRSIVHSLNGRFESSRETLGIGITD